MTIFKSGHLVASTFYLSICRTYDGFTKNYKGKEMVYYKTPL